MVSYQKFLNKCMINLCTFLGVTQKLFLPYSLNLEPTNHCNFHCPLCPTGSGELRINKGFMQWELFTRIIDELNKYLYEMYFMGFGEPLLHPKIFDMIDYAEDKNIKTYISTNASMLVNENILKKIIESKLSVLMIALDGASSQTYNKYRVEGDFEQTYKSIQTLQNLKESCGNKKLVIQIQFIIMRHNENEIESIKSISKNIGVELRLKTVSVRHATDLAYLPLNIKYRRYKTLKNLDPKFKQQKSCLRAWNHATIYWDGSVVSCCKDSHRQNLFGYISENSSFYSIWISNKFRNFRTKQRRFRKSIITCENCVIP